MDLEQASPPPCTLLEHHLPYNEHFCISRQQATRSQTNSHYFKMAQDNPKQYERLPHPRLVRTTHTEDGTSVFASDDQVTPFYPFGPQSGAFTIFDARNSIPINNTDPIPSFAGTVPRCPPGGVVFVFTDIPPGGIAPMHRTLSLDYAIVLNGEIVLKLDGGEEKTIKAGEVIVQQGVNHQWLNQGDVVCRIAFVMCGSEKVVTKSGEVLEETVLKR